MIEFEKKDRKEIAKEYARGTSMLAIAEDYGVSQSAIRRVLVEDGVAIRKRGSRSLAR